MLETKTIKMEHYRIDIINGLATTYIFSAGKFNEYVESKNKVLEIIGLLQKELKVLEAKLNE